MFEPVHSSASAIAGKGIANPLAAVVSAATMLDHLRITAAAQKLDSAIEGVLPEEKVRTPDLSGTSSASDAASGVLARV